MYSAEVQCPGVPNVYTLGTLLEALTEANCAWYLDQVQKGVKPPCCAKCMKVRYRPAGRATRHVWAGADRMVAEPGAGYPCRSIAAYDAGVERAKAILRGASMEHARRNNYVLVKKTGAGKFHALAVVKGKVTDPSRELATA